MNGKIVPWLPFAAIDLLRKLLSDKTRYWEWGCGGSTIFALNCKAIVFSVEHKIYWYQLIRQCASRAQLFLEPDTEAESYSRRINDQSGLFDIILVDGRQRNRCIDAAISRLEPGGTMILDNSDRDRYRRGIIRLEQAGFQRQSIVDYGPLNSEPWECSFFKRHS